MKIRENLKKKSENKEKLIKKELKIRENLKKKSENKEKLIKRSEE